MRCTPIRRLVLAIGPLLLLASCAVAFAQDAAAPALSPTATAGQPPLDYVIGLGPIGALIWGAWLLGKGVNITITHRHQVDDDTLDRVASALQKRGRSAA